MQVIELSGGKLALVDDCDFEAANKYRWRFEKQNGKSTGYALAIGKSRKPSLHRLVAEEKKEVEPGQSAIIDHRNGCGLDCRRWNVRVVTASENGRNRGRQKNRA